MSKIHSPSTGNIKTASFNAHAKLATLSLLSVIYLSLCQNSVHVNVQSQTSKSSPYKAKKRNVPQVAKPREIISEEHEPYLNRWQRRFSSSKARNKTGGYLFFKHIRKAGGTTLRSYFHDVFQYHNLSRSVGDFRSLNKRRRRNGEYTIHYVEQEFQAMDWQCPNVDPRWKESLRIVTLRHPIERHMSEFFFSGPGMHFPLNRRHLYVNKTYTDELAEFLQKYVPKWMMHNGGRGPNGALEGKFKMLFGRFYVDNFQLRALAGCAGKGCLRGKKVADSQMEEIRGRHPSSFSYSIPNSKCTHFFRAQSYLSLLEICSKHQTEECAYGCDGPCFYPAVGWGKLGMKDVTRATKALESYDAVLLMETFNEADQAAFLADILGVPREADFSMGRRNATNTRVEKKNKHEKTHFYRDMLSNLSPSVMELLVRENTMEIEFFNQAVLINKMKTDQWKMETHWNFE